MPMPAWPCVTLKRTRRTGREGRSVAKKNLFFSFLLNKRARMALFRVAVRDFDIRILDMLDISNEAVAINLSMFDCYRAAHYITRVLR